MMTQRLGKLDWANPSRLPESKLRNVIDTQQLNDCLTRHFSALNSYCEALNLPESKIEEISVGIISLIHNAAVERIDGDEYE